MPSVHEFSSAHIIDEQFNCFRDFVTNNYKDPNCEHIQSDSAPQKAFYTNLFKNQDSLVVDEYCDVNNFWIRMLRDFLAKNLNLGNNENEVRQFNLRSTEERRNFLREVIQKAITDYRYHQKPAQARSLPNTPVGKAKKRYHLLGFEDDEISITLVIDIGRFLGFRKPVSSDSWQYAGDAYLLQLFCAKLSDDLGRGATPSFSDNRQDESQDDDDNNDENFNEVYDFGVAPQEGEILTVWQAQQLPAQLIRSCIYKTWADHYLVVVVVNKKKNIYVKH